jgi:hypothetical protein
MMIANDRDEPLGHLLKAGYDAPPPAARFTEDLLERMRGELGAAKPQPRDFSRIVLTLSRHWRLVAAAVVLAAGAGLVLLSQNSVVLPPDGAAPNRPIAESTPEAKPVRMVPLEVKLPRAEFVGTDPNIKQSPHLEKPSDKPRPPIMVPEGTKNVALGKPVSASDNEPVVGEAELVTDGNKATQEGHLELGPGRQWVQIDLKEPCAIYAIAIWHYHGLPCVYHDVVVQVADDPDFIENVRTVYNNDYDNSAGLGIGKDLEYIEDYRGRLIAAGGIQARYVRLYSSGNTANDRNHYVEVEVYGKTLPAEGAKEVPLKVELPKATAR